MKKVVADTSALISIALSGCIVPVVESVSCFVPKRVKEELQELSAYDDLEGRAAKKALLLLNKGRIKLASVKRETKAKKLVGRRTDLGEAECFVLALEKRIPVLLMDDVDAAYSLNGFARLEGVSIKISAAAIIELWKLKKLDKKQTIISLHKMIRSRRWEKSVLEYLIGKYVEEL